MNKVANLSGGPLAPGDVIAVTPSFLAYREAVTLGQSGVAVGGAITGVSTAVPAVVTTTSAHGLVVGQYVWITGLVGNPELNGVHKVTAVGSTTTYSIDNAAAGSTYSSGGTTEQLIAIVADVNGSLTGTVGDVVLSGFTNGDLETAGATVPLTLNGKSGWIFIDLSIIGGSQRCVTGLTAGSQYIALIRPVFQGGIETLNCVDLQATADTPMHFVLDRPQAFLPFGGNLVAIAAPTTATAADYNLDITITNPLCVNLVASNQIFSTTTTGVAGHKPGGVLVRNATLIAQGNAVNTDTNFSVTIPFVVINSRMIGGSSTQALRSGTTGQLVEDYNEFVASTARGGIGPPSPGSASLVTVAPGEEVGQAIGVGRSLRPPFSPVAGGSALGAGNTELAVSGGAATIIDDATIGSVAWSNPTNAAYPEGTSATVALASGNDSHYLNLHGFGFNIPAGATIDGIRVEILRSATAALASLSGGSAGMKLIDAGVITGRNHTDVATGPNSATWYILGGHADLWGTAWTPAKLNASGFGVALAFHATGTVTMSVDYVRVIVYYHLPTPNVAVDLLGRPRPAGQVTLLFSGTATSGTAATLTDTGKAWGTNQLFGAVLAITGGTGSGQRKLIKSNTATVITTYSNWQTNPDNTSTYTVYWGGAGICETGIATSGAATGLTVSNASWQSNQWAGFTLEITSGTGSGQIVPVSSNSSTVLTIGPTGANSQWVTNPDSTSVFALYRGVGGVSAVQAAAGCYERHDTAAKETVIVDAGSAISLVCPGDQDRPLNVTAGARTYTVKYRSDAGVTPTVTVKANAEVGLTADVVATGSAAQGTYTTLTLSFTAGAAGRVIIRFGCTGTLGNRCYFDTEALT